MVLPGDPVGLLLIDWYLDAVSVAQQNRLVVLFRSVPGGALRGSRCCSLGCMDVFKTDISDSSLAAAIVGNCRTVSKKIL